MQNNPLMQIMAAARSGGNPAAIMQQLARSDPRMAQAMQMMQGKNPQQIQQMAINVAKERGINIDDVARSLGINHPGGR